MPAWFSGGLASRPATVVGMAILKDAILSIVIAVVAIIGQSARMGLVHLGASVVGPMNAARPA